MCIVWQATPQERRPRTWLGQHSFEGFSHGFCLLRQNPKYGHLFYVNDIDIDIDMDRSLDIEIANIDMDINLDIDEVDIDPQLDLDPHIDMMVCRGLRSKEFMKFRLEKANAVMLCWISSQPNSEELLTALAGSCLGCPWFLACLGYPWLLH